MTVPSPVRASRAERGMLLVPVLVLTLLLGGLSVVLLEETLADRTSVHHHETSLLALEVAEAGVVRAEMEILALADPDDDGIGTVSGAYANGLYDVTATQDPDFPDRWTARAFGERELSTRNIEVGLRRREEGYFIEGLFSDKDMALTGDISSDSYDSRTGSYASQATNSDAHGTHAGTRGHVGSNAGITLNGTAVAVRGNAIPGPLDIVETSGDPTVLGDIFPRQRVIPLPPVSQAEFEEALANNNNVELEPGGGTGLPPGQAKKETVDGTKAYDPKTMSIRAQASTEVVLTGGTYFFTDLKLAAQATLVVKGPCRIYVTGELELTGGGIINESGRSTDCLIFAHPYPLPAGHTPSATGMKVSGGAQAAFALYAPALEVTIGGNSDVFGSVVASEIKVNGDAYFHYDEALKDVGGGTVVYLERLYWRETSLPGR